MVDAKTRRQQVEAHRYQLLGDFVLPECAWWEHYYDPISERLELLENRYLDDPVPSEVLADSRLEIDNYRRYPDC